MLSHWARDRAHGQLPVEHVIEMLTSRNARHIGLHDRGVIAPGMRADLNLIDPTRIGAEIPKIVRDLPAGGRRLLQKSRGYIATWVAGKTVIHQGEITRARPGQLVRMGQTH